MPTHPEIAVAYVSIVPEVRNIAPDLRRALVGPATTAGNQAGDGAASGFGSKLKAGIAGAAIAAGALVAKGIGDAIDQSNVNRKLAAQLGASGKDAARYGKINGSLYTKGVVDTFEDGADVIRGVVNAGLLPPDASNKQLESLATKMQDVSSTFGTDMGRQTEAVSALFKNKLSPSADDALDVITLGMQKLGPNAEDLLDTFQEYPVQLHKLGLSSKQSLGLFSQGLKGGARDTDIVADALKEFSIRAVDGSNTTIAGFEGIGLSAKDMAAKVGKGGSSASKGLDTVLDRLRKVKDPTKRAALAVDLFGTQAEDLGGALFKLDPSKANKSADAVGKIDKSATKLGKNLRSGPAYEFTKFKRTLQQDLVTFVGDKVIPLLVKFGSFINTKIVPAFQDHIVPAIKDTKKFLGEMFDIGVQVYDWMVKWSPVLAGVGTLVGILAVALNLAAIGSGAAAIGAGAWSIATGIASGVTGVFSTAMGVLNAVMALNPFVLVAAVLIALGVAFVIAWKKSETFRNTVKAVWNSVKNAFETAWNWIYAHVLTPIGHFFTKIIPGWATTFKNGVVSAWNSVKSGLSSAWNSIKNHVIYPIRDFFTKTIPGWATSFKNHTVDAFKAAASGLKTAWNKIKGYAKAPVEYVIDTVYNDGIRAVWNKVAGAFGATTLKEYHLATGGILPGYTPGRDVHLAALSGGEAVMRPEWTRAVGPGYVNAMNAAARHGGPGAVRAAMASPSVPHFAFGGIFDWVGKGANLVAGAGSAAWDKIKQGASWLKDTLAASARAGVKNVVEPLLSHIPGLNTGFGQMVKKIPSRMVDSLFGYADKADKKGASANLANPKGSGVERWRPYVLKALAANGLSSSLANKVLSQISSESGGNPRAQNNWDINAKNGHPSKGLMQTIDSTFSAYKFPGHGNIWNGYDNMLAALNYAKHNYGPNLSALGQGHGYDSGGWLQPGVGTVVNKTRKPEAVFNPSQWQDISALAQRGATGLQAGDTIYLSTDGRTRFEAYVDGRADSRINKGLIRPAGLGRTR